MAKSAGNFQRVTELRDREIDPLAFRYLSLTSRYGRKLNYSDASIASAAAALESLRAQLRALGPAPASGPWAAPMPITASTRDRAHAAAAPLSDEGRRLHNAFVDALDDDLDMPIALATVRGILRSDIPPDERRWLVLDADAVLGLDLSDVWGETARSAGGRTEDVPDEVAALVVERSSARAARDFARADVLRQAVEALGWSVTDSAAGPVLSRSGSAGPSANRTDR